MEKSYLVYSCSGCSSSAQTANEVALRLHESGFAKMSCVAGIGGDVIPLVKLARRQDKVKIVLDGCPSSCARKIFELRGIQIDNYFELSSDFDVKKKNCRYYEDDVVKIVNNLEKIL